MREKTTIVKRIFLMFLVVWITFISVFGAYQKSVEAAEWVAGTIAAIGGAPIFSALLIGGVVVAGGIAVYELSQTSAEDHRNFVDGIKTGFQEFVAEREKQIALEQDSSLTDQQAADRGVAAARDTLSNFTSNAIDVVRTTGKNLKTKTVQYWNSFCQGVSNVSDNGINDGTIGVGTPLNVNALAGYDIAPYLQYTAQIHTQVDSDNTFTDYQNHKYIKGGKFFHSDSNGQHTTIYNENNKMPFISVYFLPYGALLSLGVYNTEFQIVEKASGNYTYYFPDYAPDSDMVRVSDMIRDVNASTFPVVFGEISSNYNNSNNREVANNLVKYLALGGAVSAVPIWKRTINSTLQDTHIGKAIRSGRRAKLQSGDYIGSTFVEDSIPVKKTALRVGDTTAIGKVGWDIPYPDVWDDVYSGGRPFSDVVRDTGVIGVPSDDVTSYPTDTEVEFPKDTDVQDVDDVIDIPIDDEIDIDDEIEIPERPLPDIIEDQEGDFYPTEMDLTELFPFCIPFDIIYLVQKFDVSGANAPVITLPLKYPNAIRGAMGSDRYVVTIDLGDYVVVRDVIRIFLLLLFIAGLMKVTRDLIRG